MTERQYEEIFSDIRKTWSNWINISETEHRTWHRGLISKTPESVRKAVDEFYSNGGDQKKRPTLEAIKANSKMQGVAVGYEPFRYLTADEKDKAVTAALVEMINKGSETAKEMFERREADKSINPIAEFLGTFGVANHPRKEKVEQIGLCDDHKKINGVTGCPVCWLVKRNEVVLKEKHELEKELEIRPEIKEKAGV